MSPHLAGTAFLSKTQEIHFFRKQGLLDLACLRVFQECDNNKKELEVCTWSYASFYGSGVKSFVYYGYFVA